MVILLEVLTGNSKGQLFRVTSGKTLGRSRGDWIFDDSNMSSSHAKIELDNKRQFVLVDLQSSNGILLNKQKVRRVALLPGVKFFLGKTGFVVRSTSEAEADLLVPLLGWKDLLKDYLTKNPPANEFVQKVFAFSPILELDFLQGPSLEETWIIGFGPRLVGSASWDLELLDPESPENAFQLVADLGKPRLLNLCGERLKVNSQVVESVILTDGDEITIDRYRLKVRFRISSQ